MTRTKDKFFKPGDFQDWGMHETPDDESPSVSEWCAEQANAILSKYIEESGLVVFGKKGESDDVKRLWWCDFMAIDDTHKAVLLFIEELKHDKSEGEG